MFFKKPNLKEFVIRRLPSLKNLGVRHAVARAQKNIICRFVKLCLHSSYSLQNSIHFDGIFHDPDLSYVYNLTL